MPEEIDGQLVVGFNPITIRGDKGDPGTTGEQGEQGEQGVPGPMGPFVNNGDGTWESSTFPGTGGATTGYTKAKTDDLLVGERAISNADYVPKPVSGDPVGTSPTKLPDGSVAYTITRPRSVTEFASSGGTVLGATEVNAAIAGVPDRTILAFPDRVGLVDCGSTPIVVAHAVTLQSDAQRGGISHQSGLGGHPGLHVTADDVALVDLRIVGPGSGAGFVSGQQGVLVEGTLNGAGVAPTMLQKFKMKNVEVSGYGSEQTWLKYVYDTVIEGCTWRNITGYTAFATEGCQKGRMDGFTIKDILASTAGTQYGIQFSAVTRTDDNVRYPVSSDWEVSGGQIDGIPLWDGIGVHGGRNINFSNIDMYGVAKAIDCVGRTGADGGDVSHPPGPGLGPIAVTFDNITADTGVRDGSLAQAGATFTGIPGFSWSGSAWVADSTLAASSPAIACGGRGLTLSGYGTTAGALGGVYAKNTLALTLTDVELIECVGVGIYLHFDNPRFAFRGIRGIDIWSNPSTRAPLIEANSGRNSGRVDDIGVTRGTRSVNVGEVLNTHAIYSNDNDSLTDILVGRMRDNTDVTVAEFAGAGVSRIRFMPTARTAGADINTQLTADGMLASGTGASFTDDVVANRPAAAAAYSNSWYFASDVNGGTLYRCAFVSSAWTWVKSARGLTEAPADGVWRPRDSGQVAWSADPSTIVNNQSAMVSGTQYISAVKADQSLACTKITFYVGTAGTVITEASCDVFNAAGTRICTADIATAIASTGGKTVSFTAPSSAVAVGDLLYVGLRATWSSGVAPAFRGPSTNSLPSLSGQTGANTRFGTVGTGLTSPQTSITPSSIAPVGAGLQCHWVAIT